MIKSTKTRKVSKKTKKSWRKHVDISDVESFLENSRLEERLGAPFSSRPDEELFTIDKSSLQNNVNEGQSSKLQKRLALQNKEPRCFAVLKPHTAVPDPITKRNRVRTPEERKNKLVKLKEADRKLKGILKKKEKDAIKDRALAAKKKEMRYKRGDFNVDAWETKPLPEPELNSEWLTSDTLRHTLSNTNRRRKRAPQSLYKKTSALSALATPHPGTSYNPSFEDHQELLAQVTQDEKKMIKEEAHLQRVTNKMFKKVSPEQQKEDQMKEMSEGLPFTKVEDDSEDDDPNVKSVNPPVKNMKKTLVQRRKIKEQHQLELERGRQKIEKKKLSDMYKLKHINKHLENKNKKIEILQQKREKMKALKALEPKVLSKSKFEPLNTEFQLSEELSGNLRNLKSVGNMLKDRYKSMQQRNMIAPGSLVLKSFKPNVKRYKKPEPNTVEPPTKKSFKLIGVKRNKKPEHNAKQRKKVAK